MKFKESFEESLNEGIKISEFGLIGKKKLNVPGKTMYVIASISPEESFYRSSEPDRRVIGEIRFNDDGSHSRRNGSIEFTAKDLSFSKDITDLHKWYMDSFRDKSKSPEESEKEYDAKVEVSKQKVAKKMLDVLKKF